ncbi:MAG: GSCFA domain-containing protein [Saprospiraceae bacterium]
MEPFRTVLPARAAPFTIGHNDHLMMIGSCFSVNIGERLLQRKFRTAINPFGIVYNPLSIAGCLDRLMAEKQAFTEDELFENAGLWHSWEHHGHFSKPSRAETLEGINSAYAQAVKELKSTNTVILTFGTSIVHYLKENGQVVANNHKMPAAVFGQRRLDIQEICEALSPVLTKLTRQNPGLRIIFTVSPVRHIRNGLEENQRSKAVLLLAVEALCRQFDHAFYFPAYELQLDDLRDYRFYASDMLHPSEQAVDYIWQYFSDAFFSGETQQLNAAIEKITTAAAHRPFHPDSVEHKAFKAAQLKAIEKVKREWPGLDFSGEERVFGARVGDPR